MDKLTLIFVGGDSLVDRGIKAITGGKFSHVACLLLDGVFESTGLKEGDDPYPGVWLHDPGKYNNNPDAVFVPVDVPDLEAGKKEARRILGTPYAYLGCIKGGLHDLTGIELPDTKISMNCSETITRILRACGLDFMPEEPAGSITPDDMGRALGVE